MPDQKFRSLEDIEKYKEESIAKINESRNTIEKEISDAVSKLNNTLDSASGSLNTSINVFKDKVEKIKIEFDYIRWITIIIVFYLVAMVCTNYVSESHVSSNSSVSIYAPIQKLPLLIPFIAFVIISYLAIKAYRNVNGIDNTDELHTEINHISKNKFKAPKVPNSPQDTEVEKSFFDEKKALLSSLIIASGRSISIVSNIYNEISLLTQYQKMVKDFKLCLDFYNLFEDPEFFKRLFERLEKYPPPEVQVLSNEKLWKEIIGKKLSYDVNNQIPRQEFTVSENLILLLYYERNGESSKETATFDKILGSERETQELAEVLINSQKLIARSSDCENKKEDVIAIIRKVQPFSLTNINIMLSKYFFTLNYINTYIKFLEKNNINVSYKPTIQYIIEEENKNTPFKSSFEKCVVSLAYDLGLRNFKESGLNDDFADGFARASVTLKFHDDLSLREEACKCSAKNYSAAILYSYFEKIKENDGQKIVLISELIKNKEKVIFYLNKLENPELKDLKFFQTQLKEGEWYDSSFSLLREFFDKSREEIIEKLSDVEEKISNLEEYEILKRSIELNFREVSIGTIEKLIDAKLLGAYVIMFNSGGSGKSQNSDKKDEGKTDGNENNEANTNESKLREIIDYLSKRDLDQSGDKRWGFNEDKKTKGLKNTCGLRPKYDFINFSHSTRIGILNKNQSFKDFKDEFLNDVKTILNSMGERFNIGVVVLKIIPSLNYSFGVLDDDGTSDNIQIKDLDAVKYIARLASTKLELEDQISAMKFEKSIDLLEIVNQQSFYEIVRTKNDDMIDKEISVLNKPELTNDLLHELNEKMSIVSFRSLALDLKEEFYGKEDIDKINKIIESVLKHRYSKEDGLKRKAANRPRILSQRFIKSLTDLAILYKIQRGN